MARWSRSWTERDNHLAGRESDLRRMEIQSQRRDMFEQEKPALLRAIARDGKKEGLSPKQIERRQLKVMKNWLLWLAGKKSLCDD